MKASIVSVSAFAFLLLASFAEAQNLSGGGNQTERTVLLRVRYSSAWRNNPGLPDSTGHHYLYSILKSSGSGDWWNSSTFHTTVIDLAGRTRKETKGSHIDVGDIEDRHGGRVDQEGSWTNPKGLYYLSGQYDWKNDEHLTDKDFLTHRIDGLFNRDTKVRHYWGGGYSTSVRKSHSQTVYNESTTTTVDPTTGNLSTTGGEPNRMFGRPWDTHLGSSGNDGHTDSNASGSSSWSLRSYYLYLDTLDPQATGPKDKGAFMEDTIGLLPPVPKVKIDRGKQNPVEEQKARFADAPGPYLGWFDGLGVIRHAQTWTEQQWRDQGPLWVGMRFLQPGGAWANISKGQYWLESNECDPFEITWLEIVTPIMATGGYNDQTGGMEGLRDWTRQITVTSHRTKLGKGAPNPEVFDVAPVANSENRDYAIASYEFTELNPASGFDGESEPHWLMVPQYNDNWAKAYTPASENLEIKFKATPEPSDVTVTPESTIQSQETLTVSSSTLGDNSDVNIGVETAVGTDGLKLSVKKYQTKTLAIHAVTQRYTTPMPLKPNEGKPNEVCIQEASILWSTPGGDDEPGPGRTITTGQNGVCQTTADPHDTQVIPLGQGIHKDIVPKNAPTAQGLKTYLDQVYGLQTNTYLTVTRSDFVVDYDTDIKNAILDISNSNNALAPEETVIVNAAQSSAEFNVYYVADYQKLEPVTHFDGRWN